MSMKSNTLTGICGVRACLAPKLVAKRGESLLTRAGDVSGSRGRRDGQGTIATIVGPTASAIAFACYHLSRSLSQDSRILRPATSCNITPDPPTSRTHVSVVFVMVLGSGVGHCTHAARHSLTSSRTSSPTSLRSVSPVSRPRGPEPALWGGEVHDAWPSAGISPSAIHAFPPSCVSPAPPGLALVSGACADVAGLRASVRLMATPSLTIPGLIRGGVRDV